MPFGAEMKDILLRNRSVSPPKTPPPPWLPPGTGSGALALVSTMPLPLPPRILRISTLVGLGTLVGCTTGFFKRSADREVFGILGRKASVVPNADDVLLNITPPKPVRLDALMANAKTADFLGNRSHIEKGARVISLADALDFAVHRNRTYLTRKETVYLTALNLTLTRQQFGPIFSGSGGGGFNETQVQTGVNNFNALTRFGTQLAADLTTDFTRFFTGGVRRFSDSEAAVTLSQPLLRGAGVLAASEPLRQDERNVLYAIRDFTQYRKDFAVDVVSQYYSTLQAREQARNRYMAYKASTASIERERALAEANLRTKSGVLQIEQSQITYERTWINAIRAYEDALDNLKISLGLPVTERIILDTGELNRIDVMDMPGQVDDLMETAVATRLDLYNQRERLQDAERRTLIAKQNTLPTVNALVNYDVGTPGNNPGLELNPGQRNVGAALDLDLNLNVKPERNALRAAQIQKQQAERQLELAEETVRNEIRRDWRALTVARTQYDLAKEGLALAEQRLSIEEALLEEGQGVARDLVDAQNRLIDARDIMVSAAINHALARLELWKDMGILYIEKDGSWQDVLKKERPKGDS
jgi:outer membrane protein TolC